MIAPEIVTEIQRLLTEDVISQREIAKRMGVCRGTVQMIATGRRPNYESRPRAGDVCEAPRGPVVRCRGCGGMVQMPCQACHMRKQSTERPRSAPRDWTIQPEGFMGFNLRPDHRVRHEAVHARRREQGELENAADAAS